jgi:hypothetical protein
MREPGNKHTYLFGRYNRPFHSPELHALTAAQTFMQLKRWHYSGVNVNDRYLIGVAIAQVDVVIHESSSPERHRGR